jgi:hypothetical protein
VPSLATPKINSVVKPSKLREKLVMVLKISRIKQPISVEKSVKG